MVRNFYVLVVSYRALSGTSKNIASEWGLYHIVFIFLDVTDEFFVGKFEC